MRLFFLLGVFSLVAASGSYASSPNIELLNSTLITKLHLDETPRDGQMVGAYQISFRNPGDTPVTQVPILLNPGLNIIKVVGSGNRSLPTTSVILPVKGMEMLELTAAMVPLLKPLQKNNRTEIVIHYRGYLEDISWTGLAGVKDTLHPDFTMIRAEAFAYPVFAAPDIQAIKTAWAQKPFRQVAHVELPGTYDIAGSHLIISKTITNERTDFDLKNPRPTGLMTLAIAPYQRISEGPVSISYFGEDVAGAQKLLAVTSSETTKLERLLGKTAKGAALQIVALPDGVSSQSETAIFKGRNFFKTPLLTSEMKAAILDMWKTSKGAKPGHWATGLDAATEKLLGEPNDISAFKGDIFTTSKPMFLASKTLGKTALRDYAIDGFSAQSDTVSALGFAVLHDIMGEDAFFAFVRGLRDELNSGYADMELVADYMANHLTDKKAHKFAKNWFMNGKAGKDMAKAKNFSDLVARYR